MVAQHGGVTLTVPLMVRFSIAVTFSPSGVTSMRTIQPAG